RPPLMGIPNEVMGAMGADRYSNIRKHDQEGRGDIASGSIANDMNDGNKIDRNILDKINGIKPGQKSLFRKKEKEMGKNEFLNLLTYQLQNQDPTNPFDDKKLTADLAQFSQLEQLAEMKTLMEKQSSNKILEQKSYAANLLGKRVSTSGETINLDAEGDISKLNFFIPDDAAKVVVRVFDAKRNMIAQINPGGLPAGNHTLQWNGKNLDGSYAAKGMYSFQVLAYKDTGESISAETKIVGIVKGVEFDGENTILVVNGKRIDLRDIGSFEIDEQNKDINRNVDRNLSNIDKNINKNFGKNLDEGINQNFDKSLNSINNRAADTYPVNAYPVNTYPTF
ncbi:MAG: hypothetical protein HQK53_19500, partial [Oligoflexia bacterium]|nr:hypothetical protein [Oligoflexia bacterium]